MDSSDKVTKATTNVQCGAVHDACVRYIVAAWAQIKCQLLSILSPTSEVPNRRQNHCFNAHDTDVRGYSIMEKYSVDRNETAVTVALVAGFVEVI